MESPPPHSLGKLMSKYIIFDILSYTDFKHEVFEMLYSTSKGLRKTVILNANTNIIKD